MGRIYKRKRGGNYHADYRDAQGRRHRVSLKTQDRQAAKARLRSLELAGRPDRASHGVWPLSGELVYMIDHASKDRAEATRSFYRPKARHLLRILGDLDVNALTRDAVTGYTVQREAEGASRQTVQKELVVLRRTLKISSERGHMSADPATVVPRYKAPSRARTRHLADEAELEALLAHLDPRRHLFVLLAVYAGAEVAALARLRIRHVGRDHILIPGTKRESRQRRVPIAAELRPHIDSLDGDPDDRLVGPWSNACRDLARACARAGIERVTPNDLRRTFASWLVQRGASHMAVAHLMGHTSTRMVEQVYGRMTDAAYREAVDLLACDAGVPDSGAQDELMGLLRQLRDRLDQEKTPETVEDRGGSDVPRDRVELPTRGFSVHSSAGHKRTRRKEKSRAAGSARDAGVTAIGTKGQGG